MSICSTKGYVEQVIPKEAASDSEMELPKLTVAETVQDIEQLLTEWTVRAGQQLI
jgi:hypothetical protein